MKSKRDLITVGEFRELSRRGLRENTCRRYGYFIAELDGERVQVAPYHDAAGTVVAQKVRYADKRFTILGDLSEATLFGQHHSQSGGKRLVITEGEIDAMSVAQAFAMGWPVVSVPNGAAGARKSIKKNLEFVESFDEVVFFFDNDEPGRKAAIECADLLTPGKAKIATAAPAKDANDLLQDNNPKGIQAAVWGAKAQRPDGVVEGLETWDALTQTTPAGLSTPWPGLNAMIGGVRPAELLTVVAGTGIGKSSLCRHAAHHLARHHGEKVGYIALEEAVARTVRGFVGLELDKALWLPEITADEAEMRPAFDRVMRNMVLFDHFGSLDPENLLSRIRFMAKGLGCRWIVLDHISIVASGFSLDTDERRGIDLAMTNLRSLVQETGVGMIVVSHLRRIGLGAAHEEGGQVSLSHIRGSQAIAQLSDTVLALERDQQDEAQADTATLRVLKSRATGSTGVAGRLRYDKSTGKFHEVTAFEEPPAEGGSDFE